MPTDQALFDHRYLKWLQLLDFKKGDSGDEYLTVYSCIESAKYFNASSGKEFKSFTEMKKAGVAKRKENPQNPTETRTQYKFSDKVRV